MSSSDLQPNTHETGVIEGASTVIAHSSKEEIHTPRTARSSRELKYLMLDNKTGYMEGILQSTRHRASLQAARNHFQGVHVEAQQLIQELSLWPNPILPNDVSKFRSNIDDAEAKERVLLSAAETLTSILYNQGAMQEIQDVHQQIDLIRGELLKIRQTYRSSLFPDRSAPSQVSFGS